jgi:MFS family permease
MRRPPAGRWDRGHRNHPMIVPAPTVAAEPRPLPPAFRWVILLGVSLVCFAQYYIYDAITPLEDMMKQQLRFSGADYGLVVGAYASANVFLAALLFSGVLVDKLGLKRSGILFSSLCVLGATVIAAGTALPTPAAPVAWSPQLILMLVGRGLFGIGAESIVVVNNKALARWFKGKELATAYGVNLTIMRLGTFLALNLQAPVAKAWGLGSALWFAVGVMTFGLVTFLGYLGLERVARGRPGAPTVEQIGGEEEKFRLREAFSFDRSFWFISLLCVTFYSAVFPFQSYAPDILKQKFGYSASAAGTYTSALIIGTMIFTPLFGWLVDKRGRRASLMVLGALLLIPCHALLGYTRFPPVVPIFFVGVALSLVPAALWAAIPMMVPERRLGTAFGVIGYIQNLGLMVFPIIAGKIADAHTLKVVVDGKLIDQVDYTSTMFMFIVLGCAGLVFALLLRMADVRRPRGQRIEEVLRDTAA